MSKVIYLNSYHNTDINLNDLQYEVHAWEFTITNNRKVLIVHENAKNFNLLMKDYIKVACKYTSCMRVSPHEMSFVCM